MILLQTKFQNEVQHVLNNKEHVTDDISAEVFLDLILNISYGFAFLAVMMTLYMVVRRKKMNHAKVTDTELKEKFQNFLSSFFTLPNDDSFIGISTNNEFPTRLEPKDISNSHRRKLLAKEIFDFKRQLCGQQASQLSNYFFGLGLQKEAIELANSSSWTDNIKGMQFINEFQIQEGMKSLDHLINHKNKEVAIHAVVVRISLKKNISILNKIERKLNAWEWHKILHELERLKLMNLDFSSLYKAQIQDPKLIAITSQRLNPVIEDKQLLQKQKILF